MKPAGYAKIIQQHNIAVIPSWHESNITTSQASRIEAPNGQVREFFPAAYDPGDAREIWQKAGYKVMGVCLAGKAAEELRRGAKIDSYTYAKFTWMLDKNRGFADRLKHDAEQLGLALLKKKTFKYDKFGLDKHTVLALNPA